MRTEAYRHLRPGITIPNGSTVVKTFDHAGKLTEIVNSSVISDVTTTLSSFSYGYDSDGRRTSCTEYSGDVVDYGYDWGGRLTSESRTGSNAYSVSYTLDGEGNRTAQSVTVGESTATTSFTLDPDDELTATSSDTDGFVNSYSYNANGEQTGRTLSGTSYTEAFDYDGQLTSSTQGEAVTSFAYDATGRRVSRTAASTTTNFLLDGNQVLLEKQGGTTTATYTYGNALIRKDGESPLYDGLGTARQETNSGQSVTATLTTEGFGNTVVTTGSTSSPYGFAATSGYRNDGDAGLTLVGARYYDAQVGRFITRDTYLDQKPYLYCEHDPINGIDPSGHWDAVGWITNGGAGYNFHFGHDDWTTIANGIDKIGSGEMLVGGILTGIVAMPPTGTIVGGNQIIGETPGWNSVIGTSPGGNPINGNGWGTTNPAKGVGAIRAIGIGLGVGGAGAKLVAMFIHWRNGD